MSNIPYRILSLDGNGSWTLVQVRALQEIYGKDATGHDVLQYFDLVAANSGGSLVTALLAANWPLAKILSVFLDTPTRTRLFVKLSSMARLTNVIRQGARYSTRQKYQGLASFSGVDWATPLDQLADRVSIALGKPIHFLFTASDCDRRELVIFRSNLVSKAAAAGYSVSIRLIDAIHASTTSPFSYFDEPTAAASREFSGRRFVGSDLSSVTNPILTAVTEILANRDSKIIRPMEILSIGSGSLALPVSLMADQKPPLYRAQESGSLAVTDETAADVSTYTAHLIATQPVSGSTETGTLIRLNPLIQPGFDYSGNARVPSIMGTTEASLKAFTALLKIDQSALDADDVDLVLKFCDAWINGAMANQSIRANAKYECEIGYAKFEDAKAAWIRRVPLKAPISVAKSASAKLSSTNVVPATAMSAAESVTDTIASSSFPTSAATA
ncbi:MAG TPA: patatin-like phospholipase family protein, partial [Opitutaceae bacterium]|nr:patatin-like phospholipase family protein [Opitutaceae bacterium]